MNPHAYDLCHIAAKAIMYHFSAVSNLGMWTRDGLGDMKIAAAECWKHLADTHFTRRAIHEALACLGEAARRGLAPEETIGRRWMYWMMLGDYERAWRESDLLARLRGTDAAPGHLWDGQPFEGRDVLLRCCHGLGDTIQFIRYAPVLARRCRALTVQAQRELWPLLRGVSGIERLVPSWEELPPDTGHDQEIEIMELPYAFRTTARAVPSEVPYLNVELESERKMRRHLESMEKCDDEHEACRSDNHSAFRNPQSEIFRVGLIWAASAWDARRSVPLELLAPLASIPGVELYSLQWGPEVAELESHHEMRIHDLSGVNHSILDSAALLRAMDLVICPDTMVAHLAGALGVPVWVLLLHAADWRWMADRETTPWYPTMRLFRQPRPGNWQTPIARITEELKGMVERSHNR